MNLSREDADLFFKLMWALQHDVNTQLKIVPNVTSADAYKRLDSREKVKVREALYADPKLLEQFVSANPARLPPDELHIVQSWRRFVAGEFYIFRFLKRYTVFISAGKTAQVYGVLGLYDRLEDVVGDFPLPVLVKAVLLPFKGRIIYDGVFMPYSVMFGPGIRGDLNEIYQRAKQNGTLIETLEPETAAARPAKPKKPARNWRPLLDEVVRHTEQLRQADSAIQSRAFSLLKASARLAQAAAHDAERDDLASLDQFARRTETALRQLRTALDRARID
jgi:hypothetical protein